MTPILVLGAGRMGGALVEGWMRVKAFAPNALILHDPNPGEAALAGAAAGARLNPPDSSLQEAQTVVLAVKPQIWREAASEVGPHLNPAAVVISVAAGVRTTDLEAAFARPVARVMPTTAVAIGKGATSIFAATAEARGCAHALFDPVSTTVDLEDETLMDAAVAISGSAPAYLYALIEALEAAGVTQGLSAQVARSLVRATLTGAAALLEHTGDDPANLRRQVTSPGGTTEAALQVLLGERGLFPLIAEAVAAAARRSKELAG